MIHCQNVQLLAFLQAEWIALLADCSSASIPGSHVHVVDGAIEVMSNEIVIEAMQ